MMIDARVRPGDDRWPPGSRDRDYDHIVRTSVQLFADLGHRATTVEAIAAATGIEADSIRERFGSKDGIFAALMEETAADLLRHAGRLGPVGADPAGLDELRVWIAGLSSVVHRRSTTIRLWPVATPVERRSTEVRRFLQSFSDVLRPRLAEVDTAGVDPCVVATTILAFVTWAQLTRASQMPAIGESFVDDQLAVILGNTLLPDSPRPTWQRPPLPAPRDEITPRRRSRQLVPPMPEPAEGLMGLRRAVRTSRARVVVDRTLTAAVDVIRRQGYEDTRVADIATAAGVPRRSLSAFWADRRALLQTLAHRAAAAVREPLATLPTADTRRGDLHSWIEGWLDVLERHGPVLHVWVHETGNDIELSGLTVYLRDTTLAIVDGLLPADLPEESLERRVARVVMWALLVELPYALCIQTDVLSRADVTSVLALILERGIPDRP